MSASSVILYIEDDPASRKLIERALETAGYTVVCAETALRGIDLARSLLPDLILTDINLPDLQGHELASVLRNEERFFHTPIVALTGTNTELQRDVALAAGISGYMTKPLNVSTLRDQVKYFLEGGRDSIDAERLLAGKTRYTREVVTHLEQRIRQLEDANAALQHLDQMKETFIQITAHELRTPLTLVYGYVRLLEDFPTLQSLMRQDEAVSSLVKGLVESIERMHSVVNEILIISKMLTREITMNITQIDLSMILQRVMKGFQDAINERHLSVEFEATQFPQNMRGDPELLRLAFSNLVGNAVKYTPDGGNIAVMGEMINSTVRIKVRDSGIGIDAEDQQFIFDKFHTVNDAELHSSSKTAFGGGGMGLGLPIAKGIVEAHGGNIFVESIGRDPLSCPGSTFTVHLPLVTTRTRTGRLGTQGDE
ncbi:MAG: ATP-binding protein [Aggregatilineales bacterium]